MAEVMMCDACAMEFDWPGVTVQNYHYCCEACSQGEECTCPQHNHSYRGESPATHSSPGEPVQRE